MGNIGSYKSKFRGGVCTKKMQRISFIRPILAITDFTVFVMLVEVLVMVVTISDLRTVSLDLVFSGDQFCDDAED